jgi:hypothetical protein
MKLISTLISMDVTTATKLFWRSSKMLGDRWFAECVLYNFIHMKLNCVQTIGDKIEVLLRTSWGMWAKHCDKAFGKKHGTDIDD